MSPKLQGFLTGMGGHVKWKLLLICHDRFLRSSIRNVLFRTPSHNPTPNCLSKKRKKKVLVHEMKPGSFGLQVWLHLGAETSLEIHLYPSLDSPSLLSSFLDKIILNSNSAAAAVSLQLCPTLCDPIDGSPPGSPIPGILQARTLEWVAISFSNA